MRGLENCLSGDRRGRWIILGSPARLEVLLLLEYAEPTNDSRLLECSLYSADWEVKVEWEAELEWEVDVEVELELELELEMELVLDWEADCGDSLLCNFFLARTE